MSKSIWIINDYAGSPNYGMTHRHYYLAKEFSKKGYTVTIITASYSHFLTKFPQMDGKELMVEDIDGINYLWVKTLNYGNSFSKKRILKWFQFTQRLYKIDEQLVAPPNYIICSTSAPFAIKPAISLAQKYGAKLVFEVRDIWPLTLIEIGGQSKHHPFILLMKRYEKLALKKSDIIVSNLQNYTTHIQNLGINRKAYWVSNGIHLPELKNIEPLPNHISDQIPTDKFIVGYAGKIGRSNAVHYLIDAARGLNQHKDIYFLIVGKGEDKEKLVNQTKDLDNILFIDAIPKPQVQSILQLMDVCYLGWLNSPIYQYGTSPNKIFDYMYSAKPIINAFAYENIVDQANCGLTIKPEDKEALIEGIMKLYQINKTERLQLGSNGKDYVLQNFTYQRLAEKYLNIMIEN